VVYEIRRGANGLPHVVRLQRQKCPETGAPGPLLSSTRGATPEEGSNVTDYYTPSAIIGKSKSSRPDIPARVHLVPPA
jgi:hypothetical protein